MWMSQTLAQLKVKVRLPLTLTIESKVVPTPESRLNLSGLSYLIYKSEWVWLCSSTLQREPSVH